MRADSRVLVTALAVALAAPATVNAQVRRVGVPVMRSVEYTYNRPDPNPGPFRSAGYLSFIQGLGTGDLFDLQQGSTTAAGGLLGLLQAGAKPLTYASETNARFTHTESGCLIDTMPNSPHVWSGADVNLKEPTLITTRVKARHCLYYEEKPAPRDWTNPKSFATGKLVAVMDLYDETDFVDLFTHVGSGTAAVTLQCASPVTLPGKTTPFTFADLGIQMVADFQFQFVAKPLAIDPAFAAYTLIFPDGGVWKPFAFGTVPACSYATDPCTVPLTPCP